MDTMTADEFRGIREALGYNVSQFSRLLGLPRRTVQRWEQGFAGISNQTALLMRLLLHPDVLAYVQEQANGGFQKIVAGSGAKIGTTNSQKRRDWMRVGDVTREQLIAIYQAHNGLCAYCGGKVNGRFEPLAPHGFDHVVPYSKGGKHTASNLVVCCRRCNLRKGSNHPELTIKDDET